MSLLTTMAGRRFWISPPRDGSKSTHQTSPRFIGDVSDERLDPLKGFRLRLFVGSHLGVPLLQVFRHYVRTHQFLNELADPPRSDDAVQSIIDPLVHADRQLLLHLPLLVRTVYVQLPPTGSLAVSHRATWMIWSRRVPTETYQMGTPVSSSSRRR